MKQRQEDLGRGDIDLALPTPASGDSDRWLAHVVEVLASAGGLPPAERDVLEGLLLGRAYAEIATIRGTSPHTVGVQVKALLRRVGASNSRDLFRVFLCELDRAAQTMNATKPRSPSRASAGTNATRSARRPRLA